MLPITKKRVRLSIDEFFKVRKFSRVKDYYLSVCLN